MLHSEATRQAIFSYDPPGGKMEETLPPLPGSTECLRARSLPRDHCQGEGRLRAQGVEQRHRPLSPTEEEDSYGLISINGKNPRMGLHHPLNPMYMFT